MSKLFQLFAESLMSLTLVRNGYHVQPQRHKPGRIHAFNDEGDEFEVEVRGNRRPPLSSNENALRAMVIDQGNTILMSRALCAKLPIRDPKVDLKPFPRASR